MNMPTRLTLATMAALSLAGPAAAQPADHVITVRMTGAAERPGPGDPDGAGLVEFRINPEQNRICYKMAVSDIEPPTAAHIHRGLPDEAGPPEVTLEVPTGGENKGCAEVTRTLALDIIANPGGFYVNIHNSRYPAGAIRAQLGL